MKRLLLLIAGLMAVGVAGAQTDAKPSAFAARRAGVVLEPMSHGTSAPAFLRRIESREQFARIARVYDPGTPAALPHALFVVDRADRSVYFINTNRYPFHEDFLRGQRLVLSLDHATLTSFYRAPHRRFILGTVSWHPLMSLWLFEHWDGDQIDGALLRETGAALAASFFAPVTFKANSTLHEQVASIANVEVVTQAQLVAHRPYVALNTGVGRGRLRIIDHLDDTGIDDIAPTDIVVLSEVPLALPPVAGVVLSQPSTALSHVNLLAKGWGVPNVYLRDAAAILKSHDGQFVTLHAERSDYRIARADGAPTLPARPAAALMARPDLQRSALVPLATLRGPDTVRCGGKATRLGQLEALRRAGRIAPVAPVPDGFCIPYAQFAAFMAQPQAHELIARALATPRFERSSAVRRQALEQLRAQLVELPVPQDGSLSWERAWREQLGGPGVFVRSSSNSEDLANFSGAGLYSTVPNVTGPDALERAVKTVWASVYNAEAFEARRVARLPHEQVQMAVFVQRAVDSHASGVMVTRDPFDPSRRSVVYISAKRGIGIRVVEGKRIAEQALYDTWSKTVQRFTRSGEVTQLQLDDKGGLKEVPVDPARGVLSDAQVRTLALVALQVKAALGGRTEQDIEWATDAQGRIVLLQARPYVDNHSGP